MDEQQRLSQDYSDLKAKHVDLRVRYELLKKENKRLRRAFAAAQAGRDMEEFMTEEHKALIRKYGSMLEHIKTNNISHEDDDVDG